MADGKPMGTNSIFILYLQRNQIGPIARPRSHSELANRYNQGTRLPHDLPQLGKTCVPSFYSHSSQLLLSAFLVMSRSALDVLTAVANDSNYEPTPEEVSLVLARLTPEERKWRDRHRMLKDEGYELRPRLQPGWEASWLESGADPLDCEDGVVLPVSRSADHIGASC